MGNHDIPCIYCRQDLRGLGASHADWCPAYNKNNRILWNIAIEEASIKAFNEIINCSQDISIRENAEHIKASIKSLKYDAYNTQIYF